MLWSFLVLITWKRYSNSLTHKWGTLNYESNIYEDNEITRPQYKGTYIKDNNNLSNDYDNGDEWIVYYPSWKRYIMKYCISIPLCALFTAFTLYVILTVQTNRDMLLSRYYTITTTTATDTSAISNTTNELSMNDLSLLALIKAKDNPNSSSSSSSSSSSKSFDIKLTKAQIQDPLFWLLTLGIPTILALCLPLLNFILMRISIFLNDIENHRTESSYRNHLIVKVFSFRFVCYFASLYYYCYLSAFSTDQQQDGDDGDNDNNNSMGILRVAVTLFIFLTIGHWWNLCVQIYIPHLINKWKLYQRKKNLSKAYQNIISKEQQQEPHQQHNDDDISKKHIENQKILNEQANNKIWEQTMLPTYDSFHDYVVLIVNFGYITCFSTILPITPFIVLINNLFTLRLDAYKLCRGRQRPLATKAGGLGVWEHCLHIVTIIAVFTNCGLIAFTTTQLNGFISGNNNSSSSSSAGNATKNNNNTELVLFLVIVGWEHIMLFIKYILNAIISKIPKSVKNDLKRERYFIRKRRNCNIMMSKNKTKYNHNIELTKKQNNITNNNNDVKQQQQCGYYTNHHLQGNKSSKEDDTTIATNNTSNADTSSIHTTTINAKNNNLFHKKNSFDDDDDTNNYNETNNNNTATIHDSFISPVISHHKQQNNTYNSKSKSSSIRRRGQYSSRSSNGARSCSKSPLKPNYLRL